MPANGVQDLMSSLHEGSTTIADNFYARLFSTGNGSQESSIEDMNVTSGATAKAATPIKSILKKTNLNNGNRSSTCSASSASSSSTTSTGSSGMSQAAGGIEPVTLDQSELRMPDFSPSNVYLETSF